MKKTIYRISNQKKMKKLLYTFLAVSIIFAACKKEDEVTTPVTNPVAASIVGIWTPTSVDIDSSLTTTINGEIIYDLQGEVMTYSGSQTMTPEEAEMEGSLEFTADGYAIIAGEDTSLYTYSNDILIIIEDGEEEIEFVCAFTETDLTLTMEASMDTAWFETGMGDIAISAYMGRTIHCSRNTMTSTNISQRIGNTNHSWFVKPKFNNIIKSIK